MSEEEAKGKPGRPKGSHRRRETRLNPRSPQARAIRERKAEEKRAKWQAVLDTRQAKKDAEEAKKMAAEAALQEIIVRPPKMFHIPSGAISLPAHGWKLRPYQEKFWTYMTGEDGKGDGRKKFAVLNWHRRAGKDALLLNLIATLTTRRTGMYWHAFPLLNQARRAIWEGFMNSESKRMLDYLPIELREDSNQQELRINLKTGSTYQLVGGDNPDKLTGSGPVGIGFSEYAQMSESIWDYTSPILGENKGWAVFISTPRGKNHFHNIYQYALNTPGCFAETLTIDDTYYFDEDGNRQPVISQEYLDGLRKQGKSEEFIRQEFYCDWNSSVEGAVYSKQLSDCENQLRYGNFPILPHLPVNTAWDFGFRDATAIIFFQIESDEKVRIIDYYTNTQQPVSHYCQYLHDKGYKYGLHHAPWDVSARTLHYGNSIMDIAAENGIRFRRLQKQKVNDGIEAVRANFPRFHFHKPKTEKLFDALKSYSFAFDETQKQFSNEPEHNWCFSPETNILTRHGMYPISRLPDKGQVLTLCGWKNYLNPRKTRANARLVAVTLSDGLTVKCTPDHKWLTDSGWKSAEHLAPNTQILSGLIPLPSTSTAGYTESGPKKFILLAEAKDYTGMLGPVHSGQFPRSVISTIRTETLKITSFPILNAFRALSTLVEKLKDLLHLVGSNPLLPLLSLAQLNGTEAMRVGYGIKETLSAVRAGLNGSEKKSSALDAAWNLWEPSEKTDTNRNIAVPTARPVHTVSVIKVDFPTERSDVWCLSVPGEEHFCLSNGAIVHNCSHPADALRYMAAALPKSNKFLEPYRIHETISMKKPYEGWDVFNAPVSTF